MRRRYQSLLLAIAPANDEKFMPTYCFVINPVTVPAIAISVGGAFIYSYAVWRQETTS